MSVSHESDISWVCCVKRGSGLAARSIGIRLVMKFIKYLHMKRFEVYPEYP